MRLVVLIAAALAFGAFAAGPAAPQIPGPALVRGETLLEVEAQGVSRTPPDTVMVKVPLTSKGKTAAEARAANAALAERVSAAARSAGIAPADIRIVAAFQPRIGFVGNEALEAMRGVESEETPHLASTSVEMRLRDPAAFETLRKAMEDAGARHVPELEYSLSDDSAQRRAAKADAVRRARTEAAAYAQMLDMSVGRVLRVSERPGSNFMDPEGWQEMYRTMMGAPPVVDGNIETRVRVSVDFALVPRR